jgi:hypothetical protein
MQGKFGIPIDEVKRQKAQENIEFLPAAYLSTMSSPFFHHAHSVLVASI